MQKIDVNTIKEGICFSAPVFFDDGKNMFLAAGKQAKALHVNAIKQWKIPYLLTFGKEIDPADYVAPSFDESVAEFAETHELLEL